MDRSLSAILEAPRKLAVREIPVPVIPGPVERVRLRAAGICGSDVRYYCGENPWALHTLGKNVPSPPNMVLGHEVAGVVTRNGRECRVAILAFKSCGRCVDCLEGNENLCGSMEHFGHSAGWGDMEYFPGGMAHEFTIWDEFAYPLPDSVSFEDATFLDGLAVAIHALDVGGISPGKRVGIVGLGPIGMMAGLAARAQGCEVVGCDREVFPVELAAARGFRETVRGECDELNRTVAGGLHIVIDTVGSASSIGCGIRMLGKSGIHVLLAVHEHEVALRPLSLSGERRLATSANNRYADFARAIDMMGSGAVDVKGLVTHAFPLARAQEGFDLLLRRERERVFKVVITP